MQSGLLVVKRIWSRRDAFRVEREPAVQMSIEEIGRLYRGIDGLPWPEWDVSPLRPSLSSGLAHPMSLELVNRYRNDQCPQECDLIYIASNATHASPPAAMTFLGFDFGYYESEWAVYSVVLHEVLYGSYAALREFAPELNSCLLMPTVEAMSRLESRRDELLRNGADLETSSKSVPIAVFGNPESHRWGA